MRIMCVRINEYLMQDYFFYLLWWKNVPFQCFLVVLASNHIDKSLQKLKNTASNVKSINYLLIIIMHYNP